MYLLINGAAFFTVKTEQNPLFPYREINNLVKT